MSEQPFTFTDFREKEFALVGELNRLADFAQRLAMSDIAIQVKETRQRIEKHSFTLAVIGEFKRGKSTFINALLGKEILPSDIVPTSATLNRVTYGPKPAVEIHFKIVGPSGKEVENVSIDRLSDYVTKLTPEAEAMAANVKEAVVYYPIPYCRNNVSIIDTPGFSDDDVMTAITLGVLSKVDAAIMVIMPEAPFARTEGDILNKLLMNNIGHVMFVVTAIDRLQRSNQKERLLTFIRERINYAIHERAVAQFGERSKEYYLYLQKIGEPKIFGVSGYDALEAKGDGDEERLIASGMPEFEQALEKFLLVERGVISLKVLIDRTITAGEQILHKITVERGTLEMAQQVFEDTLLEVMNTLSLIREQCQAELTRAGAVASQTQANARQQLDVLQRNLIEKVNSIINETTISHSDLNRASLGAMGNVISSLANRVPDELQEKSKRSWRNLLEKVPEGWQKTGRATIQKVRGTIPENIHSLHKSTVIEEMTQKISNIIQEYSEWALAELLESTQAKLAEEVGRLRALAIYVDDTLQNVEQQFSMSSIVERRSVVPKGATEALSIITEMGTLWNGYQGIGSKSAVSNSITSLRHLLTQGWRSVRERLGKAVDDNFSQSVDRITAFKTKYQETMATEIATLLEKANLVTNIEDSIEVAFASLQQRVAHEIEVELQQTEQLLAELQQKRIRQITLNERDRTDLALMQAETEKILTRTYALSEQLTHLLNN